MRNDQPGLSQYARLHPEGFKVTPLCSDLALGDKSLRTHAAFHPSLHPNKHPMISYEHLGMTFRGVDHARSTLGHPKPGVYLKRSRLQSFKPTVSETSGDARMRSNPTTLITSEEYAEAYIKG